MPQPYKWDDLRVFLATARAGSLLAAGDALGVNASTVSRRLGALEQALDIQLFERTPEGVIPTLAAERLLPYAEAFEQCHLALDQAVSGLERDPVGVVRVTGPPGLVDHLLVPALGRLRQRFPGIQVRLDASVGYADLSRGEADIALRGMPPQRGDLVVRSLGRFGSCILCDPATAARGPVDDLNSLPWAQWDDDLLHIPDARWITQHISDDAIVLRTSSFAAQLEGVRQGFCVMLGAQAFTSVDGVAAVQTVGAAKEALDQVGLQPLYLVGHQALRRVPRVAAVWEFLVEVIEGVG